MYFLALTFIFTVDEYGGGLRVDMKCNKGFAKRCHALVWERPRCTEYVHAFTASLFLFLNCHR